MTTTPTPPDASHDDGARAPGESVGLADDMAVPADLAALYLGMPPAQFDELCKSTRPADGKRGGGGGESRAAIKPTAAGAGPRVPPRYTLGELRAYENRTRKQAPAVAPDAGLHGWVTARLPFFAELEARERRGRRTLLGNAWDKAGPLWQERFAALAGGKIRFTWSTPADAAASRWADLAEHQAFADKGLALLQAAIGTTEAALRATAEGMGAGTESVPA